MFNVAILGASGYTGVELVRLISMHPEFEIHSLNCRSIPGQVTIHWNIVRLADSEERESSTDLFV